LTNDPDQTRQPTPEELVDRHAPAMNRALLFGWVSVAGSLAGIGLLLYLLVHVLHLGTRKLGKLLKVALLLLMMLAKASLSRQQVPIIRQLAGLLGLEYERNPPASGPDLPKDILPAAASLTAEDGFAGVYAGKPFGSCEILCRSKGKEFADRRFLAVFWKGRLPDVCLIRTSDLDTCEGPPSGMTRLSVFHSLRGLEYAFYSNDADDPEIAGSARWIELIARMEDIAPSGAGFHGALLGSDGGHVVFEFRRDLYRIGGMLPSRLSRIVATRNASQDILDTVEVVKTLSQVAEHQAAEAGTLPN